MKKSLAIPGAPVLGISRTFNDQLSMCKYNTSIVDGLVWRPLKWMGLMDQYVTAVYQIILLRLMRFYCLPCSSFEIGASGVKSDIVEPIVDLCRR